MNGTRCIRKGAVEAVAAWVNEQGGHWPSDVEAAAHGIADSGGTPLVVSDGARVLGVIHLKDMVKEGIKERFMRFRAMGIPHGDDYRRQSAHGGLHRPGSRRG